MSKRFRLILNEHMKLYQKVSTWVMVGIYTFFVGLGFYRYASKVMEGGLEIHISPDRYIFVSTVDIDVFIVYLFSIVVASGLVAEEYSRGTIKLLLIRPVSRAKVLLAKYITVFLFTLLLMLIYLMLYGFVLYIHSIPIDNEWTWYLQYIGLAFISIVMVFTISFFIATVFQNRTVAIMVGYLTPILSLLTTSLGEPWANYLLPSNLDLVRFIDPSSAKLDDMSLSFSLTVLAVHYVVIVAATWIVFIKKDIKN